jgi:hypothetical protein
MLILPMRFAPSGNAGTRSAVPAINISFDMN